jgi:hypothetical protein
VRAVEELNTGGAWCTAGGVEYDFGDVAVGADGERVTGVDGVDDEVPDGAAGAVLLGERNLEVPLSRVAARRLRVRVVEEASETCYSFEGRRSFAHDRGASDDVLDKLRVLGQESRIGGLGREPLGEAIDVLRHVRRRPRVVACDLGDVVPIGRVREDPDQRVMRDAAAQGPGTRIPSHASVSVVSDSTESAVLTRCPEASRPPEG